MLDPRLTRDWLDFERFKSRYQKAEVQEFPNRVTDVMSEPLLSVVLVTYQHGNFIESAIESILVQETTFPFEIIIGDDESSDGTREICREYAERYPDRIRLFLHTRENNIKILGRPTGIFQIAYNLLNARGKYLALTSGDDYWCDPKKLKTQVQYLEAHSETSYTYHRSLRLYEEDGAFTGPHENRRIQSIVGRHVFKKLPHEFMQIMQEDSFMKYFWSDIGHATFLPEIEPLVTRQHGGAMFSALDRAKVEDQRLNYQKHLTKVCRNHPGHHRKTRRKLGRRILKRNIFNGERVSVEKIFQAIKELRKNRVFGLALIPLVQMALRKCVPLIRSR